MKRFISTILFGLVLFSFAENTDLLSFQKKVEIELSEDMDGDQENKEKGEHDKFTTAHTFEFGAYSSKLISISAPLCVQTHFISYSVEIRPPRALYISTNS
jgi:hypothetical protein